MKTDNTFFAPEGTQINIDRMRREAHKELEKGRSTVIHRHRATDDCKDYSDCEFYAVAEEDADA